MYWRARVRVTLHKVISVRPAHTPLYEQTLLVALTARAYTFSYLTGHNYELLPLAAILQTDGVCCFFGARGHTNSLQLYTCLLVALCVLSCRELEIRVSCRCPEQTYQCDIHERRLCQ
jgi:hypothetical protein